MVNKLFAERLHQELDKIDVPQPNDERIEAFAKLLKVPRFKAEAILNGHVPVEEALREKLAEELEIDFAWLMGENQIKT